MEGHPYNPEVIIWRLRKKEGSIFAITYRDAQNPETFAAVYESRSLSSFVYGFRFGFKTQKAAAAWLRKQKKKAVKKFLLYLKRGA